MITLLNVLHAPLEKALAIFAFLFLALPQHDVNSACTTMLGLSRMEGLNVLNIPKPMVNIAF